jgi:hypothetical protein
MRARTNSKNQFSTFLFILIIEVLRDANVSYSSFDKAMFVKQLIVYKKPILARIMAFETSVSLSSFVFSIDL